MKGSPRRKWYMVLSVALALTVMASIAAVAHAATYDSPACVSSANILKACKASGCSVNSADVAAMLKACKTAGCSTSAANISALLKACQSSGRAITTSQALSCLRAAR
jgi:hypothetical protein